MVIISKAQEVVSQEAVVGGAVVIEEVDVGLYVVDSEGLVIAVQHVDTVQTAPHTGTVCLSGAANQHRHPNEKINYKPFHLCKGKE